MGLYNSDILRKALQTVMDIDDTTGHAHVFVSQFGIEITHTYLALDFMLFVDTSDFYRHELQAVRGSNMDYTHRRLLVYTHTRVMVLVYWCLNSFKARSYLI